MTSTDQITAYLAGQAPLPVSAGQIIDALSLRSYETTVNRPLNRLAGRGEMEKWAASPDRWSCLWWWQS